eukprot:5732673-Prymnesium_polylepis.1
MASPTHDSVAPGPRRSHEGGCETTAHCQRVVKPMSAWKKPARACEPCDKWRGRRGSRQSNAT